MYDKPVGGSVNSDVMFAGIFPVIMLGIWVPAPRAPDARQGFNRQTLEYVTITVTHDTYPVFADVLSVIVFCVWIPITARPDSGKFESVITMCRHILSSLSVYIYIITWRRCVTTSSASLRQCRL